MNHRYVVIEGPIGVGKTSLARRLAGYWGVPTLLEMAEENPFLERFYREPRSAALQTQLFFLLQRFGQLKALKQRELFAPGLVADFMLEKDPLFASINLDDDELRLYQEIYQGLSLRVPVPDLVIYLQAPVDTLIKRIASRGIAYEQTITEGYLERLCHAYAEFFHHYDDAPLLMVNATEINLVEGESDFNNLLQQIASLKKGRRYFNPLPATM